MIPGWFVRWAALGLVSALSLVSLESFNIAFSGLSEADSVRQGGDNTAQIVALGLWSMVIILSFIPGAARQPLQTRKVTWLAVLLVWCVVSATWSDDPLSALPKAAALLLTNYAAFRLASLVTVKDLFACLYLTFSLLLLASLALVVFAPTIGIVQHEWQHVGNWQGVFASKQGLGMVSAMFSGITLLRVVNHRRWLDCVMCGLGLACLLGSGSRGAGVIALIAVGCIVIARGRPKFVAVIMGVLWLDLVLAISNIAYFAITGSPAIIVSGTEFNFTERTFIWQFAIDHWLERPLIGFGLNGFWTNPVNYYEYLRLHNWVLDNYHDGYIGLIVETGAIGFAMFCLVVGRMIQKIGYLLRITPKIHRPTLEMTVVFLVMFFTINLTETYFLRSTNFLSLVFAFMAVKIFVAPDAAVIARFELNPRAYAKNTAVA